MNNFDFTHLHVHTEYSLLDGSAKIKELVKRAKDLGMKNIAITDHGVMYGAVDFYKEAKANGIKPIIGCEVYVASGSRFNKESSPDNFYYHLVLLAENMQGYHNLVKLVSRGFTEGYYYKPRIDIELLREYSGGLIALSACLAGPVAKNILNRSYEAAKEQALLYNEILGKGNFYLELQDHGMKQQKMVNQSLLRMNKETGIPLVCTNDSHYIKKEDAKAHEILLCVQTQKTMLDEDRMRYEGEEFYLKSPDEMRSLFSYAPEAVSNTSAIAERCNVEFVFNEYKLPRYTVPDGADSFEYLKTLCDRGLNERYGDKAQSHRERLEYELSVINSMGFVDYFLITWDFIKYALDNGIAVGPGRGSAAGSIVAYCLKITNIDPMHYELIFERFLNPERVSMPDIDIDFCYERRQEVIDYVVNKYGSNRVAQIITFGTMAARGVLRDVGRALAMPYSDVDKVAKMIPQFPGVTIEKAFEMNKELAELYNKEEDIRYLIDMAKNLEGLPRHASTHAAGVVICNEPVEEYVPLNVNDGVITTQFPMTTLEELGLLKIDFLGLRTLTVIQNAVKEINRGKGEQLDIDKIDFDDKSVYEVIAQGRTEGIFQLESGGMTSFMKELEPQAFEDIVAGIALFRPGPMDFIPKYIAGKRNRGTAAYTHPALEPILNKTYGCIVYQEQVMQIVRDLAGYSLGQSDLVRRAMSKKKTDVMAKERKNFVEGCRKNSISEATANLIFDEMTDFAKYAFNKSHAAAYAVLAYQTAWLKKYYPVEFMAALMTSVMDWTSKITEYIYECKKMGIDVLPPDINEGYAHFSVSSGKIRFGLSAIKNVGLSAIKAIVNERGANGTFSGMMEFITRLEAKELNKRCVESLIKAGAFDSLGGKRSQYITVYKQILNGVSEAKKRTMEGQIDLFSFDEELSESYLKDDLPEMEELALKELLHMEKEVLGIYVSGHPFSEYESKIKPMSNCSSLDFINEQETDAQAPRLIDGQLVKMGGIIIDKTIKYTKNNKAMAFVTIEDLYGTVEVIMFNTVYEKYSSRIFEDEVIFVEGRCSVREDENTKIICAALRFWEELGPTLWLKIPRDINMNITGLSELLKEFKGDTPVIVYDEQKGTKMKVTKDFWVRPEEALFERLSMFLGKKSIILK